MENQVVNQVLRTDLSGTIEGKKVTITYENKVGELPVNVNAVCTIIEGENPMQNTHINISVNGTGNRQVNVIGIAEIGDIQTLLVSIENELNAVLTIPVV